MAGEVTQAAKRKDGRGGGGGSDDIDPCLFTGEDHSGVVTGIVFG